MSAAFHRRRLSIGGRSPRTGLGRLAKQQTMPRRSSGKNNSSKLSRILKRSFSEPSLRRCRLDDDGDGDDNRRSPPPTIGLPASESDWVVSLRQIRTVVFASSPLLVGSSSPSSRPPMDPEAYMKEAKVVITVSIDGSPGPVRTLVKLGCSVEETIKIVVDKYCREKRTPKLDRNGAYELHQSHFSLEGLKKTEIIGDIGSRSFYLRKKAPNDGAPEIVPVRTDIPSSNWIHSFIARKIGKIIRRTRRLWNLLVCNNQ